MNTNFNGASFINSTPVLNIHGVHKRMLFKRNKEAD